ncbi:hypothetical protein P3T76_004962 [Phytophthora citrophthora]|uniref:Uncharacterized protein n=1 Tax=Phytophthora citrophthora TaxID=4793 RepID=A0AAD9LPE5_9STRA|nr:hypothetical protein P3T76_004962 [Phytophthora citrophthora]
MPLNNMSSEIMFMSILDSGRCDSLSSFGIHNIIFVHYEHSMPHRRHRRARCKCCSYGSKPEFSNDPVDSHLSGRCLAPDSVARPPGDLTPGVPDHMRQRRLGNPAVVAPRTPTSSVSEDNLATSPDTGYGLGDDAVPLRDPHGSGAHLAHRAEKEEDERPMDPRAASVNALPPLQIRVGSMKEHVHNVRHAAHRLAIDLEEIERRVDWFESLEGATAVGLCV